MTRFERRLMTRMALLGVGLTGLVLALSVSALMKSADRYFHDVRVRAFQFFTPPPTDKLVHVDIDDRSLEVIGAWPWPRSVMAEIVDELSLAGAKALAMDIIYSEPQPAVYEEVVPPGGPAATATQPATQPAVRQILARRIDHDAVFAESLQRFGRAIIPVSLNLSLAKPESALFRAIADELFADLDLAEDTLYDRLRAQGHVQGDLKAEIRMHFPNARREAMFERIGREMRAGEVSVDELRARLLPHLPPDVVGGHPLLRILAEQRARYEAIQALRHFARPLPGNLPLLSTRDEQATLRPFAQAAWSSGYVDYLPMGDGIVRDVPLFASHREYMFPQMALALACAMLDVPPRQVKVEASRVVLPRPDGTQIVIPVRNRSTPWGEAGMFMDLPWFGRAGVGAWESMYDYPEHRKPKQHVPIQFIWEASQFRHRIIRNNQNAAAALQLLVAQLGNDPLKAKWRTFEPGAADDPAAWTPMIDALMAVLAAEGYDEFFDTTRREDHPNPENQDQWVSYHALKAVRRQNPGLQADLAQRRHELREHFNGRAVLVGYIAVGAIADVVPTSLHPRCPGVVVHGVIFNSIMTNDFWRASPAWVTLLIAAILGLATTAIVAWLSPWKAIGASIALAGVYFLVNGIYLFDYHNLLVGMATPLAAIATVWSGGTLTRFILETAERRKIERSLRSYVDQGLVDYMLENENARLDGQLKEITVVFTDLEGFTTLSERLQERAVRVLNEYMTLMTPLIRPHRGHLNKMLGDGLMFFFNAPKDNPEHALDAVRAVFEMLRREGPFNQKLREQGLPTIRMRVGISSGQMIVGNCGTTDGSINDYTVLGDTANLGARLEGANKAFGSVILVNQRAWQLLHTHVLLRPIGTIQVKGKREGVMAYEPLAFLEQATPEQQRLATLTEAVVNGFREGRFAECLEAVATMEQEAGESKLTHLYRDLCQEYLQAPPAEFNGQVVLSEK